MNRAKNLPNLFLYRQTGFSQCRKLFVDKPIRLSAVSFCEGNARLREHRAAKPRDGRNSPATRLQSHACLARFARRTKKKETARTL